MKKEKGKTYTKKDQKLIELILSCKDCVYTSDELLRMDEKKLIDVRDSMLFSLRGKFTKSDTGTFIQEPSILGTINDLFITR